MKTLIRVTEIWVPNKQHTHLEFFDGLYGELADFKGASETISFAYDDGLRAGRSGTQAPRTSRLKKPVTHRQSHVPLVF